MCHGSMNARSGRGGPCSSCRCASKRNSPGNSYPDYLVLVALTDRAEARLRLFELGEILGWEKSRLSHHVGRMTDRGLVKKEKCDSDRRGAFVVLTGQGRTAIESAAPGHVAVVRRLFIDKLTPAEIDAIATASERVLAAMNASDFR
jgi:DNA-binding MarR family transcriptional regulator